MKYPQSKPEPTLWRIAASHGYVGGHGYRPERITRPDTAHARCGGIFNGCAICEIEFEGWRWKEGVFK